MVFVGIYDTYLLTKMEGRCVTTQHCSEKLDCTSVDISRSERKRKISKMKFDRESNCIKNIDTYVI